MFCTLSTFGSGFDHGCANARRLWMLLEKSNELTAALALNSLVHAANIEFDYRLPGSARQCHSRPASLPSKPPIGIRRGRNTDTDTDTDTITLGNPGKPYTNRSTRPTKPIAA